MEDLKSQMEMKPSQVALSLENFIREHVDKLERDGVILGLSGGIDSAVVAELCKRAVGPDRTLALLMPENHILGSILGSGISNKVFFSPVSNQSPLYHFNPLC